MAKKKNYTAANGTEYYRIRKKVGEDANGKAIMKAFYGSGKLEAEEKYRQYMREQEPERLFRQDCKILHLPGHAP
ncbi:hypothetical protein [Emergencia sp.]|uniref:hypothetical protein n=1 Tax=Emergencia sp. TaxID=1926557 RepID=UPI003AEF6046